MAKAPIYATMTANAGTLGTLHLPMKVGEQELPDNEGYDGAAYYSQTSMSSFDAQTVQRVKVAQSLYDQNQEIKHRRKSTFTDRKRKKLERQNRRKGRK